MIDPETQLTHPDREAFAGRTAQFTWRTFQADGLTPQPLGASDVPRFKLARTEGGVPLIDLAIGAPTAAGSAVTIDAGLATGTVTLAPGDTADLAGWYCDEVDYTAAGDGQIKPITRGRIYFHKSQGGNA